MSGVGVFQPVCLCVIHAIEQRGETVWRGTAVQVLIEPRDDLSGTARAAAIEHSLAAQRRLQTSHDQRGRDAFAANVCQGDAQSSWPKRQEIVIIPADNTRGADYCLDLHALNCRLFRGEKLPLYFACDGQLMLEPLALLLLADQLGNGLGHGIEGFPESAKLIVVPD